MRTSAVQGRAMVRALVAPIVFAALLGCGPVQSTARLADAAAQVEAARAAGAEKYAPYEWTAASLYLHKAREQVGRSDYERAIDFAQRARDYAFQARAAAAIAEKAKASDGTSVRP